MNWHRVFRFPNHELRVGFYRKSNMDTLLVRWVRTKGSTMTIEVEVTPSGPAEVLAHSSDGASAGSFCLGVDHG